MPVPVVAIARQDTRRSAAFAGRGEAVQDVGVFAHRQVRVERDARARVGQRVQRAHGHVDVIAQTAHVHADGGREFLDQGSGDASDHDRGSGRDGWGCASLPAAPSGACFHE